MGVLQIQQVEIGEVGTLPITIKMVTTDNLATITTAGYLNNQPLLGVTLSPSDLLQVLYSYDPLTNSGSFAFFTVSLSSGVYTLVTWVNPGNVLLPVVSGDFANFNGTTGQIKDAGFSPSDSAKTKVVMANGAVTVNHIGVFTDTAGTLGQDAATAINAGNIQAGVSGTQGNLIAFPAGANAGSLVLSAIGNTGNTTTTISNAIQGQASIYSIPDGGVANSNFIISNIAGGGTQNILTGSLAVTTGNLTAGSSGNAGTVTSFPGTAANGSLILAAVDAGGAFNTTISNSAMAQSSVISIPDPGAATANFLLNKSAGGQTVSSSSALAAPGVIRALMGSMTISNANYSNGTNSVAGIRGITNMVGASAGFIYGAQGKIAATGTISGSVWVPAVFGQFDFSAATISGGVIAPIWGDYGTTIGTATDLTGCRGIVMTNTTTRVINSQIYLVGGATNLLELTGGGNPITYASSAGAGTIGANPVKLKIMVDGNPKYLICADDWT